jgi:hypothetical protein
MKDCHELLFFASIHTLFLDVKPVYKIPKKDDFKPRQELSTFDRYFSPAI